MTTTQTAPATFGGITATSMIYAQGARLTASQEADLTARADAIRALTGRPGLRPIRLEVRDPQGALIGHMTYRR